MLVAYLSRKAKSLNATGKSLSSFASIPSGVHVYNSLSKTKSQLVTRYPSLLSWYVCGPTVYDQSHIGHAWCYVNFDIMRRVMEHYFDYTVVQAMNITDIDDKIIKTAINQNVNFKEVALKYEQEFFDDMAALSVKKPTVVTKVSDFIPHIIKFIETLLKANFAYKTSDGSVYFNLNEYSKSYKYGKLKPVQQQGTKDNVPLHHPSRNDFALWKAAKTASEPSWMPSWGGKGRPGWHWGITTVFYSGTNKVPGRIKVQTPSYIMHYCLARHYIFGSWVDVHSGGIDLLFPHHENEEAQCCAYHETEQWVGHWIHANLMNSSSGIKMSKSLRNFMTIKEFLQSNSSDEFRMLCLLSNYRKGMDYTEASMKLAKESLSTLHTFVADCQYFLRQRGSSSPVTEPLNSVFLIKIVVETKAAVKEHLGNDFNTAQATVAVQKLVQLTQKELHKFTNSKFSMVHQHDNGMNVIACILDFVVRYFTSLGFTTFETSSNRILENTASDILDDFVEFRSQVRQHALELGAKTLNKDSEGLGKSSADVGTSKILLSACDKLRESIKLKGILLKDQQNKTTWTQVQRKKEF